MGATRFVAVLCAASAAVSTCRADVIWDYSPATSGADTAPSGNWINIATGDNHAERVVFPGQATVNGMDIYVNVLGLPSIIGRETKIRLWSEAAGVPAVRISELSAYIFEVDQEGSEGGFQYRAHVDFPTSLTLNGGTAYWIGMSGASISIGLNSLRGPNAPGDARMAHFEGVVFQSLTPTTVGDMAFRLHGTVIPEPTSIGLSTAGLGWLAARRRRRDRHGAPAGAG